MPSGISKAGGAIGGCDHFAPRAMLFIAALFATTGNAEGTNPTANELTDSMRECKFVSSGEEANSHDSLIKTLTAAGAVVVFLFGSEEKPIVTVGTGLLAASALLDLSDSRKKSGEKLQICSTNGSTLSQHKPVYYIGPPNLTGALAALNPLRVGAPTGMSIPTDATNTPGLADATRQLGQLRLNSNALSTRQVLPTGTTPPTTTLTPVEQQLQTLSVSDNFAQHLATPRINWSQILNTGSLRGTVSQDGRGTFGAIVKLTLAGSSASQAVVSDVNGVYSFTSLQPGRYVLDVAKAGLVEKTQTIDVVTGGMLTADIALMPDGYPCTFIVNNHTPWHLAVKIVDGGQVKALPIFQPFEVHPITGIQRAQEMFVTARFRDHEDINWGPIGIDCTQQRSVTINRM